MLTLLKTQNKKLLFSTAKTFMAPSLGTWLTRFKKSLSATDNQTRALDERMCYIHLFLKRKLFQCIFILRCFKAKF